APHCFAQNTPIVTACIWLLNLLPAFPMAVSQCGSTLRHSSSTQRMPHRRHRRRISSLVHGTPALKRISSLLASTLPRQRSLPPFAPRSPASQQRSTGQSPSSLLPTTPGAGRFRRTPRSHPSRTPASISPRCACSAVRRATGSRKGSTRTRIGWSDAMNGLDGFWLSCTPRCGRVRGAGS
ncbi:hypothetical protein DFJ73DRAFT_817349, partial [Zopfochytrium polystomum]